MADDIAEIRILEWHGEPGRAFRSGELLVEFETHKALVEVRAAQAGVLRRVLASAGDWVEIGAPIGLLSDSLDEPLPDSLDAIADMPVEFLID
jgi:pyruvate/2-oxoglutarate dehydrogenase complex dihydrolipoamide acyltransferase (E2) component